MSKVCIVTGGSAGIGEAVVKRLLSEDYKVFNLDLIPSELGEYIECDISQFSQVVSAVEHVVAETGRVDAVVSNAGIHFSGTIEDTSEEDFDRVMSINVKGAYYLLKSVLPQMRQQQTGSVVLLGSDQSLVGKPGSFAYNMSKAALASMAKTTALDYAKFGIRANAVCPGTIETPLYHQAIERYCERSGADKVQVHEDEAAQQPVGRIGQPEEVAALVALLVGDEAKFITGSLQVIDGGYTTR